MGKKYVENAEAMFRAFENTELFTFIYYPQEERAVIPEKTCLKFGCRRVYENMPHSLAEEFVTPDDYAIFKGLYNKIKSGAKSATSEFRNIDKTIKWRVSLTTLVREGDLPVEAVGIIEHVSGISMNESLIEEIKSSWGDAALADDKVQDAMNLIATCIGGLYYAIYHIWMDSRTYVCFQEQLPGILSVIGAHGDFSEAWNKYIEHYIVKEDRSRVHEFADIETLGDRLRNSNSVMCTYRREGIGWTRGQFIVARRDREGNATNIIYTVTDINAEVEMDIRRKKDVFEARHDHLTNVYNRSGFEELAATEEYRGINTGFVLLDVDNFKNLNDTFGHDAGDKVLAKVAKLLMEFFRSEDIIFRYGGDEFGVLLYEGQPAIWETLCSKFEGIHSALSKAFTDKYNVTISAGVCFSDNGFDEEMFLLADEALFMTKRAGRAGCTWIDKNHKIVRQWRDEKLDLHAVNALNRSNAGVSRLEFSEEPDVPARMICNEATRSILGMPSDASPEECYKIWYSGIDKTYLDSLRKAKKVMLDHNSAECTYRWKHPQWGDILMRSGGYGEHINDKDVIYGYHHSLRTMDIIEREDDSRLLVGALSGMYFCSFYINFTDDSFATFRIEEGEELLDYQNGRASEAMEKFTEEFVHNEDLEYVKTFLDFSTMPQRLMGESHLDCEFRDMGMMKWCRVSLLPIKHDNSGLPETVLLVIAALDPHEIEEIESEQRMYEMMKLQHKAAEMVSSAQIAVVAVIDRNTGKTQIADSTENINVEAQADYGYFMDMQLKYLIEEEREAYKKKISLEEITKNIDQHEYYATSVTLLNNQDKICHLVHHFSDMGDGKHILSVTEDKTDILAFDQLTGKLNKAGFLKQVQYLLKKEQPSCCEYAILCFNVQKFKAINRNYSYSGGDRLLIEVADRIEQSKIDALVICREMADSFLCFVPSQNLDLDEIEKLCKLRMNMEGEFISVDIRCGIYYVNDSNEDIDAACDKAQMACSVASEKPDSAYYIYNEMLSRDYLEQAYILHNFEQAVRSEQFTIEYQPIVYAKDGKIASAEALVRWKHPERGIISPAAFLPTLEKSGQISRLDTFVGKHVLQMQKARKSADKKVVPISINLSRIDFIHPGFVSNMSNMLEKAEFIRENVHFEVTESAFVDIWDVGQAFLETLKESGCSVLVDDFGSGYSSLAMLTKCDCDIVKLDMSLTRSIGENERAGIIVKGIIDVIHQMGHLIVAEGVEEKEQYEFLRDNGCDFIQGYYFYAPVSEEVFCALLDE